LIVGLTISYRAKPNLLVDRGRPAGSDTYPPNGWQDAPIERRGTS